MPLAHVPVEALEEGNGESRRLAGAGLSAADQVFSLQYRGDGLGLDGGGLDISQLIHRLEELRQ